MTKYRKLHRIQSMLCVVHVYIHCVILQGIRYVQLHVFDWPGKFVARWYCKVLRQTKNGEATNLFPRNTLLFLSDPSVMSLKRTALLVHGTSLKSPSKQKCSSSCFRPVECLSFTAENDVSCRGCSHIQRWKCTFSPCCWPKNLTCDVETWGLQRAYTENGLCREVGEVLCPAVKLVKW